MGLPTVSHEHIIIVYQLIQIRHFLTRWVIRMENRYEAVFSQGSHKPTRGHDYEQFQIIT